jgi:uncharacterized RDD family membrane protein YckC
MNKKIVIRRIIAGLIDWNLIFIVGMLLLTSGPSFDFSYLISPSLQMFKGIPFLLGVVWMLAMPLLRDCVFGGASLGKLICGIRVRDLHTGKRPAFGKLILRGIFFWLILPEFIVILANRGRSIADMASQTAVVLRKDA